MKKHILENVSKLMSACVIMKIEEFTLYRVTTSGSKQMPKEFISGSINFKLILFYYSPIIVVCEIEEI